MRCRSINESRRLWQQCHRARKVQWRI